MRRRAALTLLDTLFQTLTAWLAPMLCFTMEEAWLNRFPGDKGSMHLRQFPAIPSEWRDDALAEKWRKVRAVRRVVTGALEIERKERRIGSSLEAAPKVYIADQDLRDALAGIDLAEIAITSGVNLTSGAGPEAASTRCRAWPWSSRLRKAKNAPAPGRSWRTSGPIPNFRSFPLATRRPSGSSTRVKPSRPRSSA
jgi:isoleucyl-tRNA synthetase